MERQNWLAAFLVILVLPFFAPNPVSANRRSQGAQGKDSWLDAVFEDRSGVKHAWTHVKINSPDGESTELETKDGDTIIHLSLARIKKVSMVDEKATPDGYAKATISFLDGSESTYELRVEERGDSITLIGATKGGRGEVALLKCKYIQFAPPTPATEEKKNEHPPAKK